MRIVSPLILLLALLPFLGIAQPRPPDPDFAPGLTEVQIARNPNTVIDGGGGTIDDLWVNPDHARVQDDAYATLVTTTKNKRTNYLLAQNFGFNIPAGSSIAGIIVQVDRNAVVSGGTVTDSRVRLIDATGTIGLHDESSLLPWPTLDLDNYQSYGGLTNTWGLVDWTAAKINSANFGVAIAAETSNDNATFNLFVDEIRVTVVYITGAAARYAVASGLWTSTSSWSNIPGGPAGASVPADANDAFIGGGFTITYNTSVSVNSLTVGTTETNPTGNLTFDANNRNMTVYQGGLVITSDGNVLSTFSPTITVAGDVTLNSVLTNTNFTISMDGGITSSIVLNGTGTMGRLLVQSIVNHIGSVKVTKALAGGTLDLVNASSAHLTYSGTSANMSSNVLDLSAAGNTVEFSQTLLDAPDFNIHKGSDTFYHLVISGNAPKFYSGDITVNGDLAITATGILSNQNQQGITLFGNWTNNNGVPGFVPNSCNSCTVIFTGGNAQTITNTAGEQFHRIEVNKIAPAGTALTAGNSVIVDNQLLMSAGDFDIGSNSLTGTANTICNGGELIIGSVGTTVPSLTGTYTLTTGVITFNGAGAQTIRSSTSTPAISTYRTVRFLGNGTKSLSGPITVSTNLTIGGGATLDVTSSNFGITLGGNWTSAGIFVPRSGTVLLNGTVTQNITNLAGENFNNLTVNNLAASSAVILNDPVAVNGLLTFTDGHIVSADTSLLTLGAGVTVASASDGSHVDGPVAKTVTSTAVFAFPIGTGTNYMPASITPTSTTNTTFKAEYFSLEQSTGNTEFDVDHVSAQDYWTIERTSGTVDAAVTLVWEYASAAEAEIDNLADLVVAQWDGSNWASRGNAGTTGTFVAGSVKSNTVSSFTPQFFVIGSTTTNNPLSNFRYFAPLTGNWNDPGVWAYRPGGPATAPEPTSNKLVVIQSGNTVTIPDSPSQQATKFMRSLTILGSIVFSNSVGQDITVNVGDHGLTLGSAANITGSDIGDRIKMSGNIALNNTSNLSHAVLETNFTTPGRTITGSGGKLPILNVNQNGQIFTGTTSFTTLTVGSTATNNGTVTITGSFSGNGLTNGATGTVIWQGTSISGNGINATAPGNTIQLVNNTGGSLDIDDFVSNSTYGNLILGGANNFVQGADVTINGDLTILSGAAFNISSNDDLNIFGNWTNDGTFNATSGTVAFNGTTTISGASTSNFNHVLISGSLTPTSLFNVRGNFTNNGSFAAGTGTVAFNGTAAQSISGTVVTIFNNINVTNSTAAVQVQSNQNLTGVLTLSASSVFDADGTANDKIFTLLSTSDNPTIDASVATLPVGASVTGQVTAQRYMAVEGNNGGRIYRYISSPVQNAPVSQIQPFIPVTGIFAGSSSCSGCTTNPSMFLYDETVITDLNGNGVANFDDGNRPFPVATNAETFSPGRGYLIFVRGDVDPVLTAGSALWSLRGPINSGNVSLPVTFTSSGSVANDGWNLVGNPYPSTIDWDAAGWTRTNLDNTTYMLDNGLATPVFATHVAGGASANGGSRYIATGQAFFVKSNGGTPSLQATESVKAPSALTNYIRTGTIEDIMRVTLRQGTKADETVIQFKHEATAGFDLNSDAYKLDNPAPMYSIATITSGTRYVINALPAPTSGMEVPLDITSVTPGSYSLDFSEFESFADKTMAITLRDNFLGTSTDIRENQNYSFQVTSDSRSFGSARFTVVFGVSTITGLEPVGAPNIAIYPVPSKNIVSVEVKSGNAVTAKVISLTGALLLEQDLRGDYVKKGSFNLEEQADGVYILLIQDGTRQFRNRILKIR